MAPAEPLCPQKGCPPCSQHLTGPHGLGVAQAGCSDVPTVPSPGVGDPLGVAPAPYRAQRVPSAASPGRDTGFAPPLGTAGLLGVRPAQVGLWGIRGRAGGAARLCAGFLGRGALQVPPARPGEEPGPAAPPAGQGSVPSPLRAPAPGPEPPPRLLPSGTYFGQGMRKLFIPLLKIAAFPRGGSPLSHRGGGRPRGAPQSPSGPPPQPGLCWSRAIRSPLWP